MLTSSVSTPTTNNSEPSSQQMSASKSVASAQGVKAERVSMPPPSLMPMGSEGSGVNVSASEVMALATAASFKKRCVVIIMTSNFVSHCSYYRTTTGSTKTQSEQTTEPRPIQATEVQSLEYHSIYLLLQTQTHPSLATPVHSSPPSRPSSPGTERNLSTTRKPCPTPFPPPKTYGTAGGRSRSTSVVPDDRRSASVGVTKDGEVQRRGTGSGGGEVVLCV